MDAGGAPLRVAPSFSIIVPTWGDGNGLERTLTNLIMQDEAGRHIDREVLVIGDGFENIAKNVVSVANEAAQAQAQNMRTWYYTMPAHTGNGNIPRAKGLEKATREWVVFIDSGTAVCHQLLGTLAHVIKKHPDAVFVSWDMVQLMDPVPVVTTVSNIQNADLTNGLPYVFPGCATAVRRDVAQSIPWPDVRASDWAYFSTLWNNRYGIGYEKQAQMDQEVVLIPWALTVAYGNRTDRKSRMPISFKEFESHGYNQGYNEAMNGNTDTGEDHSGEIAAERESAEPVPDAPPASA